VREALILMLGLPAEVAILAHNALGTAGFAQVMREQQLPAPHAPVGPDLVLLGGLDMPDQWEGLAATVDRLRPWQPIILAVLDPGRPMARERAFASGAVDYVALPLVPGELVMRVSAYLYQRWRHNAGGFVA